jgi:diguanylate cyclase
MTTTPSPTRSSTAINAVARETLRRIAQEQISPTPEAYARIYAQIAATHPDFPKSGTAAPGGTEGKISASIIARLLTQLEVHHSGITITRKREGLKRALVPRLEPLDSLFGRLNRLMDSWNGPNAETGNNVSAFLGTDIMGGSDAHEAPPAPVAPVAPERLSTSQAFTAPSGIFGRTDDLTASRNYPLPHSPAARPHTPAPAPALRPLTASSEMPERMISFRLAGLLALLLKNIDDLTPESALLGNQIEQIGRVLTAPLTEKKLDETERCLRALIVRQGAIKHSIDETKRAVRELAETLLERLATLVNSTDSYATKVVDMAERIAETNDLGQLSTLTKELVSDARLMSQNVQAERTLLVETQARAAALQQRTVALESELREASALVRTDPLTRAMNRRGFGDAFQSEMNRCESGASPSIVLIDVDNFKRINEEHGHSIGDEVLCAVVEVLHRCAAPANTVARYGGEEFALMFPATSVEEAERAVVKMQRALTDHLTSGTSHLPTITFSAGIARVANGESLAIVITRADRALRQAKRAGKNCIVVATAQEAPTA